MTKELIAFVIESNLRKTQLPAGLEIDCGWGNGYVAIPEGHPCFGMDYNEIHEKFDIDVHGGLTFSGMSDLKFNPPETKGMWVVGFDTAHSGDTIQRRPNKASVMAEANSLKIQLEKLDFSSNVLKDDEQEIFWFGNETINIIQALIPLLKQREACASFYMDKKLADQKPEIKQKIQSLNDQIKNILHL